MQEVVDEQPGHLSSWLCLNLSLVVFARICLLSRSSVPGVGLGGMGGGDGHELT